MTIRLGISTCPNDTFAFQALAHGHSDRHGLTFALDYLAIAVTELGSISERRTDRMLDPQHSAGLTPFLAKNPGVESGYMLAQYTAAALVAENRVLSHPASVESIPTSRIPVEVTSAAGMP